MVDFLNPDEVIDAKELIPDTPAEQFLARALAIVKKVAPKEAGLLEQKADFNRDAFALRLDFLQRSAIRDKPHADYMINARRRQLQDVIDGRAPTAAQFNKGLSPLSIVIVERYRAMLAQDSMGKVNALQNSLHRTDPALAPDRHRVWQTGLAPTEHVVETVDMDARLGTATTGRELPVLNDVVDPMADLARRAAAQEPQAAPQGKTILSRVFDLAQSFRALVSGGYRAAFNRSSTDSTAARHKPGPTGPAPL